MSDAPQIVDLPKVIEPHLAGGQLISYQSRYLTKPGDNYGSVMLAITANVRRADGQIEELPLVAKLPPITNELYWQIFQPQRTCVTENAIYKCLEPALRELQLRAGIQEEQLFDGFSRYYGSRISLAAASSMVDRDAVLLQENLQTSGFRAGDRHRMYDLAHARLVLQHVAQYHALPIALRLQQPAVFEQQVRPYVHRFNMNTGMAPEVKTQMHEETLKEVQFATNNNAKAVERVKELLRLYDEFLSQPDAADTPFTTVVHCDMWINNLMLQYDESGTPSSLKIVDFQVAQYESLAHDVLFLLFSSVDDEVLEQHFHDLLRHYYNSFLQCLQRVGVVTADYSYDAFWSEIKRVAPIEVSHALFMTKIILADNSTMPEDFKDMDMSVLSKNTGVAVIVKRLGDIIRLAQKFDFFD